jgi:hypothetical protein
LRGNPLYARLGEAADIDCDMVEDQQTDAAAPRAGQPSRSAARNAPSAAHMSVRAVTGNSSKAGWSLAKLAMRFGVHGMTTPRTPDY